MSSMEVDQEGSSAQLGFRQMAFPPDVLARIAPDVSLQRHLAIGLRPSLRGFNEFKPVEISEGGLNASGQNTVAGSAIVKSGDTRVVCGITLGVVEENTVDQLLENEATNQETDGSLSNYTSVYPVVEIARGRSGAPTDEEMILSQKLYETILHNRLVHQDDLKIIVGTSVDGEVIYPDSSSPLLDSDLGELISKPKKNWSYVLYAHIKVFSRAGPLFDLCYSALVNALQNTRLPRAFVDDKATDIKIPVRSRGNFGHLKESYNLLLDQTISASLPVHGRLSSSSFGVVSYEAEDSNEPVSILLADLEGEAEESCAESKINVIASNDGELRHVSIVGGGALITKQVLKDALDISRMRGSN
ncbi:exosome complex component Rrp43p [[Candida] anglica]|uniref:Ribosomal RNA-processing protein 43 n=1 Tax=[Candida] anglica TaxID=148631 RepID=A0ABP0EL80_9ASCO